MMRRLLILGVVTLVATSLTACGRKGNPSEPDDAVYPRIYPYTPLPAPPTVQTAPEGVSRAPQPRRQRPDEFKPPVGDPDTGRTQ